MTARYHTIFLLSPANLSGVRGELVFNPQADFPVARQLKAGGAPLGELFSVVSSLYFRGKVAYATAFAHPPQDHPGALVITPGDGLCFLHEPVTLNGCGAGRRFRSMRKSAVHRSALASRAALLRAHGATTRFVLLGSVASGQCVDPLVRVLGERLLFPGLRRAR